MSYRIRQTTWDTGERYCMLVDAETGMPPWYPMLFITTRLGYTDEPELLHQTGDTVAPRHPYTLEIDALRHPRVAPGRPHRARAPLRPVHHGAELQHRERPPAATVRRHASRLPGPAAKPNISGQSRGARR